MQLITYNLNGIRAAIRNGLMDWLSQHRFDVLCFQEVKATHDVVDLKPFEQLGYTYHWHAAEKKGYSGVATFAKVPPMKVSLGFGLPIYDAEGRVLRTDFGDLTILNTYFPSGTSGEVRQGVKMAFLNDFFDYVQQLRQTRPNLLVVGDYNIAHRSIDIHDPIRNKNTTGFLPEERAWLDRWFEADMVDAFRFRNPNDVAYSWWSYRAAARQRNKGWRIDYVSASGAMAHRLLDCRMLPDAVHADHCPVWVEWA